MKKIRITFLLLAIGSVAWGQTNKFPSSGPVGIGETTNLTRKLTVNGGIDIFGEGTSDAGLLLYRPVENGTSSRRWFFRADYSDNSSYPYLTNRTPNGKVVIKTGSATGGAENTHFTIEGGNGTVSAYYENVKLGIGTNNPRSEFNINAANGESWINQYGHLVFNHKNVSTTNFWTMASRGNGYLCIGYGGLTDNEYVDGGNDFIRIKSSNGNVGIGVNNPDSKLVVDGKIRSEEVKVEIINGPDYVFDQNYELRTLQETKEYISKNKHLPEIPSAKEMEMNGVELGDMNMRLLKKIEELTLYQIELLERIEKLEKKVD